MNSIYEQEVIFYFNEYKYFFMRRVLFLNIFMLCYLKLNNNFIRVNCLIFNCSVLNNFVAYE